MTEITYNNTSSHDLEVDGKKSDEPLAEKFGRQLREGNANEKRLGEIIAGDTIELKSESHIWERTGNICVEYLRDGDPSGISVTKADWWIHELTTGERDHAERRTLAYIMFPMERMKELARKHHKLGDISHAGGDGNRTSSILVPLKALLDYDRRPSQ